MSGTTANTARTADTAPAQRLRALLARPGLITMPCCYDALSARLIHEAGFPLTLMSGFAVSAARLALPDTGLISFAEMLDSLRNVCAAAPALCVIGDGDTGYGNTINVRRTVREYAQAGLMPQEQIGMYPIAAPDPYALPAPQGNAPGMPHAANPYQLTPDQAPVQEVIGNQDGN